MPKFGQPGCTSVRGPGGRKKMVIYPKVEVPEDGAPGQLQDMRFVYSNHKQLDTTEGQRRVRKLLEKNYKGFLSLLNQMEKEHEVRKGAKKESGESGPIEADVGTEKCVEMYEEWLRGK